MQFGCTYAAVNVARVCTVALDHGIRREGGRRKDRGRNGVWGRGPSEGGQCALIDPVSRSNLSRASSHYHRLLDVYPGQFSESQSAAKCTESIVGGSIR